MSSSSQHLLPQRILPLFDALKISPSKYPFSTIEASRHALNPLLIPTTSSSFSSASQSQFIFEQYQYTALGNAVIHRAVSREVAKFFINRRNTPASASPNTTRQLIACFHNALAVRFVAESLPLAPSFDVTATTTTSNSDSSSDRQEELNFENIFASAKPGQTSPSRNDKKGTSFDWAPFGYAQSDLGPRLTHFLGAVELYCGREIALEAARRAFFDLDGETGNIPYEGAQLLATLSKKYNPQNVSKALLAAQGLNTRFLSRSIVVKLKGKPKKEKNANSANINNDEEESATHKVNAVEKEEETEETKNVAKRHESENSASMANSSSTSSTIPLSSHALGPGNLNMMKKWSDKVLRNNKKKPSNDSVAVLHELFGGSGFDSAENKNSTTTAQWPHRTTLPVVETNADRNGIPDILSAVQYANRKLRDTDVKDADFHDKAGTKNKDGVEFSTGELSSVIGVSSETSLSTDVSSAHSNNNNLSTKSIVNTLTQPHDRFFEVTFVRDPIISSTNFRREVYSTDVPRDVGHGRTIPDLTKSALFEGEEHDLDGRSKNLAKVGPKVLAKGVGKSFGEGRKAAAMNYLQAVISDLSIL